MKGGAYTRGQEGEDIDGTGSKYKERYNDITGVIQHNSK